MTDDIYQAAEEAFDGDREMQKRVLISKLTPKQKLVYNAIQVHPEAANDDALLLAIVWREEGWSERSGLVQNLRRVSRPETLSRRRRELFNLGLISYSRKSLETRENAFRKEVERASPILGNLIERQKEHNTNLEAISNYEQTRLV